MNLDTIRELFSKLTWVDYIVLFALARGMYVGYKSGFFTELLRVVSYGVTLVATILFYDALAQLLTLHTPLNSASARVVSFGVLFVALFIGTRVVQLLILSALKVGEGGFIQHLLGMLLGTARMLVVISFLFMLVDVCPGKQMKEDVHGRSLTGDRVARVAPTLLEFLSHLSPHLAVPGKSA